MQQNRLSHAVKVFIILGGLFMLLGVMLLVIRQSLPQFIEISGKMTEINFSYLGGGLLSVIFGAFLGGIGLLLFFINRVQTRKEPESTTTNNNK